MIWILLTRPLRSVHFAIDDLHRIDYLFTNRRAGSRVNFAIMRHSVTVTTASCIDGKVSIIMPILIDRNRNDRFQRKRIGENDTSVSKILSKDEKRNRSSTIGPMLVPVAKEDLQQKSLWLNIRKVARELLERRWKFVIEIRENKSEKKWNEMENVVLTAI